VRLPNSKIGGTGFYFDKAKPLPDEIEHHMPDYHLYDDWIEKKIADGLNPNQFKEYSRCSIGFLTRGCFRHCKFCVNQNSNQVVAHSPVDEFYDPSRKSICLLDDNFFGCPDWRRLFESLLEKNRPVKFKQGLDERLLTDEKCRLLFNAKYDGDYYFAFDNIEDYDLIKSKLELIRKYTDIENIRFYVLGGFKNTDADDLRDVLRRIELLMQYHCVPYFMRYQSADDKPYKCSEHVGMYNLIARWCNQPSIFKTHSLRDMTVKDQQYVKGGDCASARALKYFVEKNPELEKFVDMKWKP